MSVSVSEQMHDEPADPHLSGSLSTPRTVLKFLRTDPLQDATFLRHCNERVRLRMTQHDPDSHELSDSF